MVKVIATYGPSLYDSKLLAQVCQECDVIRQNISHQDPDDAVRTFNILRRYNRAIMIDTSGPEVRLHTQEKITLRKGDTIEIGTDSSARVWLDQPLHKQLEAGHSVYLDDGMCELRVEGKSGGTIIFKAVDDVCLRNRMAVNLRGRSLAFPILKDSDIQVLRAVTPSFIALSYTRTYKDVREARRHTRAKIIAKIENKEGISNVEEILAEADGVMIARGDLGIEVPAEEVPILQKRIVELANNYSKPSVVATQVLYSMVDKPVPTRAEVSDIANAVLDGTDAILLSNETAVGKYPLQAIRQIKKVGARIAPYVRSKVQDDLRNPAIDPISDMLSKTLRTIALNKQITKIVVITRSGYSARLISRFKIHKPIIAITTEPDVALEMSLLYNVVPVRWTKKPERHIIPRAALLCLERGLLDEEDTVVFAAAVRTKAPGVTNTIEVHKISDMMSSLGI